MQVKTNSLKAWTLAARPKTLTGAVAPVLVGIALAWYLFMIFNADNLSMLKSVIPSLLCVMFALLMQIDANFINDYFDFKKGADTEERLGPERACAQGWITPGAMKNGIIITSVLAFIVGLPLVVFGGWWMLAVGLFCLAGAFLYTTIISYKGLGGIMVILFFGIIPVCFTFHVTVRNFLQSNTVTSISPALASQEFWVLLALVCGLAVGLIINNLLIVNNYRDREQDAKAGKRTVVVKKGALYAEQLYKYNGIVGFSLALIGCLITWVEAMFYASAFFPPFLILMPVFMLMHWSAYRNMVRINHGRELNKLLGQTSQNILAFSLLLAVSILSAGIVVWYSR